MPAAFVENTAGFYADFGVPVSYAGSPAGASGILDDYGTLLKMLNENADQSRISADQKALMMDTPPTQLVVGSTITVDGTPYIVSDPSAWKDGAMSIVLLADAS